MNRHCDITVWFGGNHFLDDGCSPFGFELANYPGKQLLLVIPRWLLLVCCCSEIKERIKKTKDEKKAKKAEIMAKTQKTQTKAGVPKGAKGPKLGGGGGKR